MLFLSLISNIKIPNFNFWYFITIIFLLKSFELFKYLLFLNLRIVASCYISCIFIILSEIEKSLNLEIGILVNNLIIYDEIIYNTYYKIWMIFSTNYNTMGA